MFDFLIETITDCATETLGCVIENGGDIVDCVSDCVSDRIDDLVDNIDDLLD